MLGESYTDIDVNLNSPRPLPSVSMPMWTTGTATDMCMIFPGPVTELQNLPDLNILGFRMFRFNPDRYEGTRTPELFKTYRRQNCCHHRMNH